MAGLTVTNSVAQKSVVSLNKGQKALEKTLQHLATGKKLNASGDNASGMVVSKSLSAVISQAKAAQQNISNLQALFNTADSVLSVVGGYLDRLSELATMAQGAGLSTASYTAIDAEAGAIVAQITTKLNTQQFNGTNITDGSLAANYVVGAGTSSAAGTQMTVNLSSLDLSANSTIGTSLSAINLGAAANAATSVTNIDAAIAALGTAVGTIGQYQQDISNKQDFIGGFIESLQASLSAIKDADLAQEAADFTKNNVIVKGAAAMLAKANSIQDESVSGLLQRL